METESNELPFLSNIGFMMTYKCTVACPHCIVEAGPHRKEEMRLEDCLTWIEQARAYRGGHIKGLGLTGGEPFYNMANLARISNYGRSLGFIVSAVTNAYWAPTREAALNALSAVPAIQILSISTDVYHQKAIPLERVKNAVWAARELGRLYNIAVCTDNEEDPRHQQIMDELEALGETERVRVSVTFPVGRAQKSARHWRYRMVSEPSVSACTVSSTPVIFPDGRVVACIGPLLTLPPGHALYLGNLYQESLAEVLDRSEMNPILHIMRVWGPHKLVSLLREHGYERLLPTEFIRNCLCDVCYKLLSDEQIVAALREVLKDEALMQTIAYARLYYLHETRMAELCGLGVPEIQAPWAAHPAEIAEPAAARL